MNIKTLLIIIILHSSLTASVSIPTDIVSLYNNNKNTFNCISDIINSGKMESVLIRDFVLDATATEHKKLSYSFSKDVGIDLIFSNSNGVYFYYERNVIDGYVCQWFLYKVSDINSIRSDSIIISDIREDNLEKANIEYLQQIENNWYIGVVKSTWLIDLDHIDKY